MPSYPVAENREYRQKVLELRAAGMTYKAIAKELNNRSVTWVANICREHNLGHSLSEARWETYREYKRQGHTTAEVAKHFGVSLSCAEKACRGIAPQKIKPIFVRNQYTDANSREEYMHTVIERYLPDFEYVGGYTGRDGSCDIKCKICGAVQTRSIIAIRHKHIECTNCHQLRIDAVNKAKETKKAERQKRTEERKVRLAEEVKARLEARRHLCPVCGKETTNIMYCSLECSKKRNNQVGEIRRRLKIKNALVDNDITLQALSRRDDDICYLCGEPVDWNDKEEHDGVIICGNNYPSIDHVLPLAKGGKHSWDNVRLAHRICNSMKSSKYAPHQ